MHTMVRFPWKLSKVCFFSIISVTGIVIIMVFSLRLIEDLRFLSIKETFERKNNMPSLMRNRPHVVLFFSQDCGSCRTELEAVIESYEPTILPIIGISLKPYKHSPLHFIRTVTGESAKRLFLLFKAQVDYALFINADGMIQEQKLQSENFSSFYLRSLDVIL